MLFKELVVSIIIIVPIGYLAGERCVSMVEHSLMER